MKLLNRSNILFFITLFWLSSLAQKKYQGLLWEISGNGLQKPSYLYGTMHVSAKKAYHLSDSFFVALSQADVVGLESNPDQWLKNMKEMGLLESFNNPNIYSNTDFYRDAFKINIPDNVWYSELLAQEPAIINGLLYRNTVGIEEYEESTYLDLYIYQIGTKLNKSIVSLENFKTSLVMASKGSLKNPYESSTNNGLQLDLNHIRYAINEAYKYEDLDQLDSLMHLTYTTKYAQKYLIDDRNLLMLQNIDSICKKNSLFVGVGAAHLPGENGLIELLRKKGYSVRAVSNISTKKGNKLRTKVERLDKIRLSNIHYADDSLYSFSLFQQPIHIASLKGNSYYLLTDMANGAYYSINRQLTYAPIFNYKPERLLLKIDSLLYESIPGKILSKKHIIDKSGIQGIDLINKTLKGDLQHCRIYFTKTEMIIFKMSAKGSYVDGDAAKQFFNSIKFYSKKDKIFVFSPNTQGFYVTVPNMFHYISHKRNIFQGLSEELFAYDKQLNACKGIMHYYYNDFNYLEEDSFELRLLAENTLKNFGCVSHIQFKMTNDERFPTLIFSGQNQQSNKILNAKLLIKGVHYYLIYELSDKNSVTLTQNDFINSFHISDFKFIYPRAHITDDDLGFIVFDEIVENEKNQLQESLVAFYRQLQNEDQQKNRHNDVDFDTKNKNYYSPSTGEHVLIEYTKYNDYSYMDSLTFWKNISYNARNFNRFAIVDSLFEKQENREMLELTLKVNGCSRVIKRKYILEGNKLFCLSTVCDSSRGLTLWADSFFKSFRHHGSLEKKVIFYNKTANFFKDLVSKDSLLSGQAKQSLVSYEVSLKKESMNEVLSFMKTPLFFELDEVTRASIIYNASYLKQESFIPVYRSLYKHYEDSGYMQICVLKALGNLTTKKSYETYFELLLTKPPLTGSEQSVETFLSPLFDSLELCADFFPDLIKLTKLDEYKIPIYKLFSNLVIRQILPSKNYEANIPMILAEANQELKRYHASAGKLSKHNEVEDEVFPLDDQLEFRNEYALMNGKKTYPIYHHSIERYASLLMPFYSKQHTVKQFVDKLFNIKDESVLLNIYLMAAQYSIPVADSIWNYFGHHPKTMLKTYEALVNLNLTDKLKALQLSQTDLCKTKLVNSIVFADEEVNLENIITVYDSLYFIEKKNVRNNQEEGEMYFFYRLNDETKEKNLAYVYINKPKSKKLTTVMEVIDIQRPIDRGQTIDSIINEVCSEFYYKHRSRYVPKNSYADNYVPE